MVKNLILLFLLFFIFNCENPININDESELGMDCTLDLGGVIDECGICSGGTTGRLPNSDKDICGVCDGSGLPEGWELEEFDKNGDGESDTFCGCVEQGETLLSEDNDFCCNYSTRDACGVCGGTGEDFDEDGDCDEIDLDDDNDSITDANDLCQFSINNWISDASTDYDGDGCKDDEEDEDDDNDGALDDVDSDDNDTFVCSDDDGDMCDDCSSGVFDVANDGTDNDGDGQCNDGDADDDNDGALDEADSDDTDATVCSDDDADLCDDCSSGTFDVANDGIDFDSDGLCDQNDNDDDNDGLVDALDDCDNTSDFTLDLDFDSDGCDDTDEDNDDDNDGIIDALDDCDNTADFTLDDDFDNDGCDADEDNDDDNDGALDDVDDEDDNAFVCSDADDDGCDDCITGIFDIENDNPSGCDNACSSTLEFDECGVCGGSGIVEGTCDCDGTPPPQGFCDCNGNVLDDCGVCDGGNASKDECGVCDGDSSSCADCCGVPHGLGDTCDGECGVCNYNIVEGACDCDENIEDDCGVCGGEGICADANEDGECDNQSESGLSSFLYESINNECYYINDIDVISALFNENGSIINQDLDIDGNQNISRSELLTLGTQQWENHRLIYLDCSSLDLSGELTDEIGSLSELKTLNLSFNQFEDEIPGDIGSLNNLEYLYLNNNGFELEIPEELENLGNLNVLNLSNNKLEGEITENIFLLNSLISLDVSENTECQENNSVCTGFSGTLPQTICNINIVNIQGNKYCQIPDCLSVQDYEGGQYTCNCNASIGKDCNNICDGSAYLNDCGVCVGGLTGLNEDEAKDICGACYGGDSNQDFCEICYGGNISCSQGLLTLAAWELNQKQIFNNTNCEGPLSYIYNNDEICSESECSNYDYIFDNNYTFILNIYNWDVGEIQSTNPSIVITGEWSLPIISNNPIINGNPLHIEYNINEELVEIDFISLEFLNDYQTCKSDINIGTENHLTNLCQTNHLILTQITEEQCIISSFISK